MLDWIGGAAAFRGQTDDEEEEEQDEEEGGLDSTAGWSEHGVFSTGGADKSNAERDAGDGAGDAPQTASWRAWGSSALRAVAQLDAAGVARIARSTLEVVHRDVSEFTQAVAEDARDLATVGSTVVLPELKATAQGLKASLAGVVPGTLEEASSALLANLASVRPTHARLRPAQPLPGAPPTLGNLGTSLFLFVACKPRTLRLLTLTCMHPAGAGHHPVRERRQRGASEEGTSRGRCPARPRRCPWPSIAGYPRVSHAARQRHVLQPAVRWGCLRLVHGIIHVGGACVSTMALCSLSSHARCSLL